MDIIICINYYHPVIYEIFLSTYFQRLTKVKRYFMKSILKGKYFPQKNWKSSIKPTWYLLLQQISFKKYIRLFGTRADPSGGQEEHVGSQI